MRKMGKRVLGLSILLSLLGGSSFLVQAYPITNQSEADAQVNTNLTSGDYFYDSTMNGSGTGVSQIAAAGDITVHGEAAETHSLTMNGTLGASDPLSAANVESEGPYAVSFEHLTSVDLNLMGNPRQILSRFSNVYARNGGTVTVQDSVNEFRAENTVNARSVDIQRSNIFAESNGTIRIYSPDVTLVNNGLGENVRAGGGNYGYENANVYLGDENHILHSISITNRSSVGDERHGMSAVAGSGVNDAVRIYAFADHLSITNEQTAIRSNGAGTGNPVDPDKGALIQLGNEAHPIGNITLDHNTYGALAQHDGKINMYGRNTMIDNTPYGLMTWNNGQINIGGENFTAADRVETAIELASPSGSTQGGTINIHTSGKTTLKGAGQYTIYNQYGHVNINNNASDGATRVEGVLYAIGNGAETNIDFHNNQSSFYGNAYDWSGSKTKITVSNGGAWTLNPARNISGYTTRIDTLTLGNGGTVYLGGHATDPSNNRYSYMETTHLEGDGGTLVFRTNLQQSADTRTVYGHGDMLVISDGGTSSGTHDVTIYDHSYPSGPEANGGYVWLIHDGSTTPGAVFRGSANLQDGGLFARPVEITNEAPDASLGYRGVPTTGMNWYARIPENPVTPIPLTPTPNAENNMTFSRSRYGALWIEQETLRQRLGELRDHKQDDGIWARITRGEYTMNGVSGNADYTMYHIGYDKQIGNQERHKQYIGMAYHHTDTDLNYRHFTDDSDMDADIGTIYYTNLGDKGHYLDIVGKFGRMKGKMKTFGEFPESAKWDSPFYSLSAEYGRKILYDNGWYWEPQAQLTYSHLGSDNYLTSQGTHAHLDNINSLIFRTGFTIGKKNGRNEYYGKVFWHHEFEGAEDTYFHDKNDDRLHDSFDFGSSWVTVGLGGQVGLSKDAYLYGDVEKSFGGDVKKKWAWNVGVRFGF